jgi:hypothetical protein
MKKLILGFAALAIAGANVPSARAGDGGWSTAGKVLTGVAAGVVIGQALSPAPAYAYAPACPAPVYSYGYCPPPAVVYAPPPPVVVYRAPVYVAPPVVSFSFGFWGGHHHHDYWHGRR